MLRADVRVPPAAIVLDDVITTGATLRDAAALLGAAGCTVIAGVVLARTPPGRKLAAGGTSHDHDHSHYLA